MPNVSLTVYLKDNNGHYAKYNADRTKYNKIATMAMKEALDVDTTVEEKDLLDEAENQEEEYTDNILEEVPIHPDDSQANKQQKEGWVQKYNIFKKKE